MTRDIFSKIAKALDDALTEDSILLLDNFFNHKGEFVSEVKHPKVIYLPANSTSKTQPLAGGIISV